MPASGTQCSSFLVPHHLVAKGSYGWPSDTQPVVSRYMSMMHIVYSFVDPLSSNPSFLFFFVPCHRLLLALHCSNSRTLLHSLLAGCSLFFLLQQSSYLTLIPIYTIQCLHPKVQVLLALDPSLKTRSHLQTYSKIHHSMKQEQIALAATAKTKSTPQYSQS